MYLETNRGIEYASLGWDEIGMFVLFVLGGQTRKSINVAYYCGV